MSVKNKILSLGLCLLCTGVLLSCNNNSSGEETDGTATATKTSSAKKSTGNSGKCYEDYLGQNMENLLTKEDITKYVSMNLDEAKVNDWRDQKDPEYQHYYYIVKAGPEREKTFKTPTGTVLPINYEVGINGIKIYSEKVKNPLQSFRNSHHTLSETEKENAKAAMNKALGKSKDLTEAQKSAAGKGTGSAIDQLRFTEIEGLGDAATWSHNYHYLSMLVGNTVIDILVDVSDDENENIEVAKKLATEVLKKCNG